MGLVVGLEAMQQQQQQLMWCPAGLLGLMRLQAPSECTSLLGLPGCRRGTLLPPVLPAPAIMLLIAGRSSCRQLYRADQGQQLQSSGQPVLVVYHAGP